MNWKTYRKSLLVGLMAMLAAWPAGLMAQPEPHFYPQVVKPYRIAACDWMMLKRQKIGEFKLVREIGADGVEMDMGPLGQRVLFDNKLRDEHFQQLFRRTADSVGVAVPSMAMSGFFAQNFLKRDNYRDLISDCLQSMRVMGARVAFLPLGGSGHEWKQQGPERTELVRRLHEVGEMARLEGKIIAIRTQLDARADIKLLKEINSEGIKIYYNLQDAVDQGRDPAKELKKLGRRRVAQIHASLTDSVTLDVDPRIDMYSVRRALDKMKWCGWLVVERSRNAKDVRNVKGNFGRNVAYLKKVFCGPSPQ